VVVHKLDRFARSVVVALGTFKLLSDLGIAFLSLSEAGMDFTTPMGKVLFNLMASFAEYYSENLGLETKKGKAERKAQGLHNGLVPFGYRSEGGAVAEPDPETAEGARLAFRLAAEGQSLSQIARALSQAGYRTAGNMRRGVFTKDTVRSMLRNRFYVGELPLTQAVEGQTAATWQSGKHSALIDEETFHTARRAIEGRATASRADRQNARVYSLSGLLRCYHCGERMRVVRTEHGRVRYHCRSKAQGLGCSGKGSLLDVYEAQIVRDLERFTLPDDWKAAVLAVAGETQPDAAAIEGQRRQLQARRERLKNLYTWEELTAAEFRVQCAAIDAELPGSGHPRARPTTWTVWRSTWRVCPWRGAMPTKRSAANWRMLFMRKCG
jgi:hypothetical protein